MFRNILTGVAAVALVSGVAAQQQMTVKKATVAPVYAGSYHPAIGFQPAATQKSGPDTIWNNMILTNYYSIPGADQEWIDEGILADRNTGNREQINGFDYVYCSATPDAGTFPVVTTITFYDETVRCAGPATWPAADCGYVISGLPGGDPNGALQCWIVGIDLQGGGFECDLTTDAAANKLFGWGGAYNDSSTGPWISVGGNGIDNSFTWFDPTNGNGAFVGCFWFGGIPFANFAMQLYGNPRNAFATYSATEGAGADDNVVMGTDVEATAGTLVTISTSDFAGAPVDSLMWVSATRVDNNLTGAFGIDAHEVAQYASRIIDYPVGSSNGQVVPNATGTFYLQGANLGGGASPVGMSNALEVIL